MRVIDAVIGTVTKVLATIAGVVLLAIMLILMANVILRPLGAPIFGIVDIVQFMMLTLIMAALAFTQSTDSHIWVDVFTSKMPTRVQRWFEGFADILTFVVAAIFAAVMLSIAIMTDPRLDGSGLITIPSVPFKVFAFVGFLGWALEALRLALHVVFDRVYRPDEPEQISI